MNLAERDLAVAKEVLAINDDWASNISYNAMLQAGRALMFSKGYRPHGAEPHLAVRDFLAQFISHTDIANFDRIRRKRHAATYDHVEGVSHSDAESAYLLAVDLVGKIRTLIQREGFHL